MSLRWGIGTVIIGHSQHTCVSLYCAVPQAAVLNYMVLLKLINNPNCRDVYSVGSQQLWLALVCVVTYNLELPLRRLHCSVLVAMTEQLIVLSNEWQFLCIFMTKNTICGHCISYVGLCHGQLAWWWCFSVISLLTRLLLYELQTDSNFTLFHLQILQLFCTSATLVHKSR